MKEAIESIRNLLKEGVFSDEHEKLGYEIPLNRHLCVYTPPRALVEIEAEMKALKKEIAKLLEGI